MKRLILIVTSVTALLFISFIAWMNLTRGYFQYGECGCSVGYYTDDQVAPKISKNNSNNPNEAFPPPTCQCMARSKAQTFIGEIELLLAKLDFNRGPKVSTPTEPIETAYKNYHGKFFSFSYPSTWKFSSPNDTYVYVGEDRPGANSFTLRFREAELFDRVVDVVDRIKSNDIFSTAGWGDAAPQEVKREATTLAGRPATKFTYRFNNLKNSPTLTSTHLVWVAMLSDKGLLTLEIYGNDEKTLNQILNSIQIVGQSSYSCPKEPYVNCMPGYGPNGQPKECRSDYLNWAKANCSDFQGAAY